MVAVAVAVSGRNAVTPTVVDGARSVTDAAGVEGRARPILLVGCRIEVACGRVGAPVDWDVQVQIDGAELVVSLEENLDVEVAAERPIRGQLGNQNALVITGNAIGEGGLGEPHASGEVGQPEPASYCTVSGFENGLPRGLGRLQSQDITLAIGRHGWPINADGEIAVKFIGRERAPNRGDDTAGCDVADGIGLKEVARRQQFSGCINVAKDRAQLVGQVRGCDEEPVAIVSREIGVSQRPDVQGDRVDFNPEIF